MPEMTKTMANSVTHYSFFIISAILASIFAFTKATNNSFSLDLIHRDSPNSPFYDPSLSYTKRMSNSFHRSFNRSKDFGSRSSSIVASNNGEYLMKFSLGTPPVHTLGVADTGSDLTWTQCLPCKHCFKQQPRLFNPKKSSTYKSLPCNSKKCHAPFSTSCNRTKRTCEYQVMYGDQSYSVGDLATETIRFGSSKNTQLSLKNTIIGCGHNNAGTFSGDKESGIVGLGGGKFSLISQMGSSIGGKFSYCLAPLSQHNHIPKSKIYFGTNAIVLGNKVVTTPLAKKSPATFYFLTLEGVSVGKKRLDFRKVSFSFGEGNIILDSGTVLTLFSPEIYVKLEAMVKEEIKLPTVTDPTGALSLCYKSLSVEKIPIITMHFKGADVKLGPLNTFVETSESSMCFAFAASYGVSIYGNIAQMNFLVGYDLKRRSISFKAADCSK
ncbi:aspartic proteinase CDR1-like [Nicotiana tabacum]|uniref:Aspartic proteinase CDR1-like n=3 Tax=Nicotiana TaxID=4085 RepID=A0A1S3X0I7_TOBAC|nr:PREDICTED: aspartic proteinase CDR1-like [Nicotiana sylvestris]